MANKARIEAEDFGGGNDLGRFVAAEWTDDMGDKCGFQDGQIVGDGCSADLARPGEARGFEDAAALGQDQLKEFLKRMFPFQPKELEYILGPEGIEPFREITGGRRGG